MLADGIAKDLSFLNQCSTFVFGTSNAFAISLFVIKSFSLLSLNVFCSFVISTSCFLTVTSFTSSAICINPSALSSFLFLLLTVAHDTLEQCILYPVSFEKLQTQKMALEQPKCNTFEMTINQMLM